MTSFRDDVAEAVANAATKGGDGTDSTAGSDDAITPRSEPPVVVKIGGAEAVNPASAIADIAALVGAGRRVVVTHGGSTTVDETLDKLGIEPDYVETPDGVTGRFTDAETMEAFEMALPGRLNTELVASLRAAGVDAVGLSGVDGGLLRGPRKSAVRIVEDGRRKIRRGDHSGRIESVNDGLLDLLLGAGYVPVVTVPMLGVEGADGDGDAGGGPDITPVNADADRAAAAVAGALGGTLVLLTDVAGVYADPDDPDTLIDTAETPAALDAVRAAAEGFMTRKVMAAEEALDGGAGRAIVADANAETPVRSALAGSGTHIAASALAAERGDGAENTDADHADDGSDS